MKISKKITAAAEPVVEPVEEVIQDEPINVIDEGVTKELAESTLNDAKTHVHSAIKSLGAYVKYSKDPKGKEAIANLSVVLLDMQSFN